MTIQAHADAIIHRAVRSIEHPYAIVGYYQPGFEELPGMMMYTIIGGPSHGSSVTAETLVKLGIEVPR